jgi:hypothetical protein
MTSVLTDNFLVDQLTMVVSIIPIWISPQFLQIFDQKHLIVILDDWRQDQRLHFLNRECPKITFHEKKLNFITFC